VCVGKQVSPPETTKAQKGGSRLKSMSGPASRLALRGPKLWKLFSGFGKKKPCRILCRLSDRADKTEHGYLRLRSVAPVSGPVDPGAGFAAGATRRQTYDRLQWQAVMPVLPDN